jgi:hypothetical protein
MRHREYLHLLAISYTERKSQTHASADPHQHTELVVIWVHPPGGPGWGGARDLDFLIKESIMRIRNRPSDNPMMLLRRRKQNEDTGGNPRCHTTEVLSRRICQLDVSLSVAPPSFVVKPGRPSSEFARVEAVQYPHLYRGGVEHDADHGTEGLGGEVVLELCADNAGVACGDLSAMLLICLPLCDP